MDLGVSDCAARSADRLAEASRRSNELTERSIDALSDAVLTLSEQPHMSPGESSRRIRVTAVVITAAAVGVCGYMWWRLFHTQDHKEAQLLDADLQSEELTVSDDRESADGNKSVEDGVGVEVDNVDCQNADNNNHNRESSMMVPTWRMTSGVGVRQHSLLARTARGQRKHGSSSVNQLPDVHVFRGPKSWSKLPVAVSSRPYLIQRA